jgi:hypothetical protein
MENLLIITAITLSLYFGYKDDYKRNKKGFVITIVGILSLGIGFILLNNYNSIVGIFSRSDILCI